MHLNQISIDMALISHLCSVDCVRKTCGNAQYAHGFTWLHDQEKEKRWRWLLFTEVQTLQRDHRISANNISIHTKAQSRISGTTCLDNCVVTRQILQSMHMILLLKISNLRQQYHSRAHYCHGAD